MNIRLDCYKDRNGNIIKKEISSEAVLRFMYTNPLGRTVLKLLGSKQAAEIQRLFLDCPLSALLIDPFMKKNGISLTDYVPKRYSSFNDFFTREIRHDRRSFACSEENLISPSDGRITVYKINHNARFRVKDSVYSVSSLLRDGALAEYYQNGYFVLVRLCVDNYHHYAYSVSGHKSRERHVKGFLHSVNPVVYDYTKVYKENTRCYSVITTGRSERIVQMEVGAMGVGKICNHLPEDGFVRQGHKKGHFEFGGSSIILLLPANSFVPDKDLLKNTAEGYETAVKIGEKIGGRKPQMS